MVKTKLNTSSISSRNFKKKKEFKNIFFNYKLKIERLKCSYFGHHIEFERHGNNVESDHARNNKIEIFAIANVVQEATSWRIACIVRNLAHFYFILQSIQIHKSI